jgi:hypothetical protein
LRPAGHAALAHPFAAVFTAIGADGATLAHGDVAVVVDVEAGEGGLSPGLDRGDHDGPARTHAPVAADVAGVAGVAAGESAMSAARTAFGAGLGPVFAAGVELGPADHAVVVGVEPFEAGVDATLDAGEDSGAALLGRDGAVAVGVGGGQAFEAAADELGLAEAVVAVGVGAHAADLRPFRGLLGEGGAAGGGEGQGGQAADQKGLVHLDVSMAARRDRTSLSGG